MNILTLLIIVLVQIENSRSINTFYNDTFVLPTYNYIEFLRSIVMMFESDYDPGSMAVQLSISGNLSNPIPPTNNQQLTASPVSYDLLLFSDSNNQQFLNYIKAIQNQQWVIEGLTCIDCSLCLIKQSTTQSNYQINLLNFNQTKCCANCSLEDTIQLNILGQTSSVPFTSFKDTSKSPMIVILDNTPFPDGNTQGLEDLYIFSSYSISVYPDDHYFTVTLVLCIAFGALFLIGSAIIISMRRQYLQAKAEESSHSLGKNHENEMTKKNN